jgi:hypothetical protein
VQARGPLVTGLLVTAGVTAVLIAGQFSSRPPNVRLETPHPAPSAPPASGQGADGGPPGLASPSAGVAPAAAPTRAGAMHRTTVGGATAGAARSTAAATTSARIAAGGVTRSTTSTPAAGVSISQSTQIAVSSPSQSAPSSSQAPAPAPAAPGGDVYYANCAAARRAGASPLVIGEPGYRPGLDRDGDGLACE